MSEALSIWLFAGGFGLIAILFTLQWNHVRHCKEVGEAIVRLDQAVRDLKDLLVPEIARLRDHAHDNKGSILRIDSRVSVLEERTK